MMENQPTKEVNYVEYAWGATAAEHAAYDCTGIPYFQRGRFLGEAPDVSQHIPMYRSVQNYEHTESNGIEGKTGLLYRAVGYDYIPFDIDSSDTMEAVLDARTFIKWLELYGVYDYHIYWSGSKGIHITLPWANFQQSYLDYTPAIIRTLVERYISILSKVKTFDVSVYNNRALFRVENTRNAKTGFFKIELTRDELFNMDIGDIEVMAMTDRESIPHQNKKKSDYSSLIKLYELSSDMVQLAMERPLTFGNDGGTIEPIKFIEDFVDNAHLKPGSRHNVSLTLAAYYRARGYSQSETEEAISNFMSKCTGSNTPVSQRIRESKNDVKACYSRDVRFSFYRAKEIFGG